MQKEVISAKNLEEAKKEAYEKLNASEQEVIIIEKEVKTGLFNKKCEIYAVLKTELNKFIKDYLYQLLKDMGMQSNIEIKQREESIIFNIITDNSSILIGKNGKTVDSLQTIVGQAVYQEIKSYYKFVIDVNDYKQKKQMRIEKLAKFTAKSVARTKIDAKLEPMNSYERRIVHNILSNSKDVTTESIGEEPNRCVVIKLKQTKED